MRIRPRASFGAPAIALVAVVALCAGACTHAWGELDPGGGSSSSSSSGGGHGGTATSSSSTTSSSGTGGTMSSSSGTGGSTSSSSGTGGTTSSSSGTGGSTTSSSSSSSSGTGGSGPTHCGCTNLFSWDFSAPQPYVWGSNNFTLMNGQAVFTPAANATSWSTGVLKSERLYDLRGDEVSIHVLSVPNQPAGGVGDFELDYDNGDDLFMSVYGGNMKCGYDRGGTEHLAAKQTYDPVAHAYWKLREDQGTIYCETSPDGSTWSPLGSFNLTGSLLAPASAVRLVAFGGVPPMTATPGQMVIDDLHGGPLPASWCPVTSFTDGFTDMPNLPGPNWDRSWTDQPGDSFDQQGDQLNFHFGADPYSSAGYLSSAAYDLTGQRATIQLIKINGAAMTGQYFALGNDDNHDVYWDVQSDGITCSYDNDNGNFDIWTGPLPTFPAWLGIRESGGLSYCEIYENGMWKAKASIANPMDVTAVDVVLATYTWGNNAPGAGVTSFDSLGMGP